MFCRLIKNLSVKILRRRTTLIFALVLTSLLALSSHYGLRSKLLSKNDFEWFYKDIDYRSELLKNSVAQAMKMYKNEMVSDKLSPESRQKEYQKMLPIVELGLPYVYINPNNLYIPQERVVHLDLKGGPPTIAYLKRLFPILKTLGATALLIEYEDMFPFNGLLKDIRALNAYSKNDIQDIITTAQNTGLKIIPLIQTFGHLEFALKRQKFSSLREDPKSPSAICPSQNKTISFIELMILQVMELHQNRITHLHIGCDEVFHLGECLLCSKVTKDDELNGRDALFLQHVSKVVEIVRKHWPKVKVLIWDDMLRHMSTEVLLTFKAAEYVEPMVWVYIEDIYRFAPPDIFHKYAKIFKRVWAASAFKGAHGETLTVPDAKRHLENNLQWLKVMASQSKQLGRSDFFSGIVLTGWSRYDHFAVLCELLPASLPSLVMSLIAVTAGSFNASHLKTMSGALGCPSYRMYGTGESEPTIRLDLANDPPMWRALSGCLFPGSQFFALTNSLYSAKLEAEEFMNYARKQKGWLTDYNRRHNFTSPDRIKEITGGPEGDSQRILKTLVDVAKRTHTSLKGVLMSETAKEWIELHAYTTILSLEKLLEDAKSMSNVKHWKRRPLKPPADLNRFNPDIR